LGDDKPAVAQPTNAPIDRSGRVHAERVKLLFGHARASIGANVMTALLASLIVYGSLQTRLLLAWLGMLLLVSVMRAVLAQRYQRLPMPVGREATRWLYRMVVLTGATGACWGLYVMLLLHYGEGEARLGIAAYVAGGLTAGSVVTLGSHLIAYACFSLPIMLGTALGLALLGDTSGPLMGLLAIGFEAAMLVTARRTSELNRRDIEARLAKGELVDSLTATTHELTAANRQLLQEIAERERAEAQVEFVAQHDALTGLPNRLMQNALYERAVAQARRDGSRVALLFVDLDGFKPVNDSLGHEAGDRLLCQVAERLRHTLLPGDSVCRHGGDEFVLLKTGVQDNSALQAQAAELIATVSAPYRIGGGSVTIGASIGISLFPDDGDEFDLLLRRADQAMYQAKRDGRGRARFFVLESEAPRRVGGIAG